MTRLSKLPSCLLLAVCSLSIHAEDKAASLRTRLEAAAADTSLDTPGLVPWHLKLIVQLNDKKGNPGDKGSIETWWIDPAHVQTVYSFPRYTATEVLSPEGMRRTKSAGLPPDILRILLRQIVHPVSDQADIDHATLEFRQQNFAKMPFECVILDRPIPLSRVYIEPPLGLFPFSCFDRSQGQLRLTSDYALQIAVRNAIGTFQGRHVATNISLNENGVITATAAIAVLQSGSSLREPPVDEAGLEPIPALASSPENTAKVKSLNKPDPIYPPGAKQRRAKGSVVIRGIVGQDGHIHSLRLVDVPDVELAQAALAAIRDWLYEPYTADGHTYEVDTTVTVNFTMN